MPVSDLVRGVVESPVSNIQARPWQRAGVESDRAQGPVSEIPLRRGVAWEE